MMADTTEYPELLDHVQRYALIAAAVGSLACIIGWIFTPHAFYTAWLWAWMFFLGISLGSLSIVMLHHLTGGRWGRPVRAIMEAAMTLMPLVAILFIPICFGLPHLYQWARPDLVEHDEWLQHVRPLLNPGFWIVRALLYFTIWSAIALFLSSAAMRFQSTMSQTLAATMRKVSAFGILVYAVTMSLAAVDWVMSRQNHWPSTVYGFIYLVGQALSAFVFSLIVLRVIVNVRPLAQYLTPQVRIDLGNLVLTLVILWAYLSFVQLLVIWIANIEHEIPWYTRRGIGPGWSFWEAIGFILIIFHFFIPFFVLLIRQNKRHFNYLVAVAALVLAMRLFDLYWLVIPSSFQTPRRFYFPWPAPFALLAIGGVWVWAYIRILRQRPLLSRIEGEEEPIISHDGTAPTSS